MVRLQHSATWPIGLGRVWVSKQLPCIDDDDDDDDGGDGDDDDDDDDHRNFLETVELLWLQVLDATMEPLQLSDDLTDRELFQKHCLPLGDLWPEVAWLFYWCIHLIFSWPNLIEEDFCH